MDSVWGGLLLLPNLYLSGLQSFVFPWDSVLTCHRACPTVMNVTVYLVLVLDFKLCASGDSMSCLVTLASERRPWAMRPHWGSCGGLRAGKSMHLAPARALISCLRLQHWVCPFSVPSWGLHFHLLTKNWKYIWDYACKGTQEGRRT